MVIENRISQAVAVHIGELNMATIQELMQQYFRNKARELVAVAQQAICEHPGLRGGHREDVLRVYLNSFIHRF
jgi:hypothetical protein